MRQLVVMAMLSVTVVVPAARAGLVGTNYAAGTLIDVNPADGSTSNPRPVAVDYNVPEGLTRASNGTVYGLRDASDLVTVNLASGATTVVRTLNSFGYVLEGDLAFSPDGTLFALAGNFNGNDNDSRLVRIDTVANTEQLVRTYDTDTVDDVTGLFFLGNRLYALDNRANETGETARLYRLDPGTGAIIDTLTTNLRLPGPFADAAVDPTSGTVYVADSASEGDINGPNAANAVGTLYTLDLNNGRFTALGTSHGLYDITGLSYVPTVPEPSVASLAAAAVWALSCRRRR